MLDILHNVNNSPIIWKYIAIFLFDKAHFLKDNALISIIGRNDCHCRRIIFLFVM